VLNNGALNVNAASIVTASVTGAGTTSVAAGGQLTADSIIQNALVIGGTSANPSMLTIDASDSLGNPLIDTTALTRVSGNSVEPLTVSSINSSGGNDLPLTPPLTPSGFDGGSGEFVLPGNQSVPEPPSLCLAIGAMIVICQRRTHLCAGFGILTNVASARSRQTKSN
jgi:hypothetical protein